MNKIKIGIVGVGHLGKLHLKMINDIEDAECSGIFDTDIKKAEQIAQENKIKAFLSLEELILNSEAIVISAPTSFHHNIAMSCLENGKHIFIEKPITTTIEQAQQIIELSKAKDLLVQVGHIERFNPALLALDKYELKPMFIQSDRLSQFNPRGTDVAVVLDLMIHDIDIILNLVKSEVEKVDANGVAVVSDSIDIANARIQFTNGCVANVTASRISQKKMRKMRMFQRDAYITIDFLQGVSEIYRLVSPNDDTSSTGISYGEIGVGERKKKVVYEQPEVPEVNALKHELNLFIQSIRNRTRPIVTAEDGKRALEVAEMIINQIKQNQSRIIY
ncbi:MAG: Gfo/Idh/MocA family oxidoreductase [Ignavibacteria bacterium]|nr:Gfo/Idh/MocA family oxidoreductase [Ignavibacteria bacterium]